MNTSVSEIILKKTFPIKLVKVVFFVEFEFFKIESLEKFVSTLEIP